MISGKSKLGAIAGVLAGLFVAGGWASPGTAQECSLAQLLQARAAMSGGSATFQQERHLHYLTEPVRSSGRLLYRSPDHLELNVEIPYRESFVHDNGTITIESRNASTPQRISSDANTVLSTVLSGILGTLSGNQALLEGAFEVEFASDACTWTMRLVPKAPDAAQAIHQITVQGKDARIEEIAVEEGNGDQTKLTLREHE